MKLRILSDLHLEIAPFVDIPPIEPTILILAGDICCFRFNDIFFNFLDSVADTYEYVLVIPGNHEYYGSYLINGVDDFWNQKMKPNIINLHRNSFFYENYKFIGATLWTDFNKADPLAMLVSSKKINDFRQIKLSKNSIRNITPHDTLSQFKTDFSYIESEIDKNYTNIVITHYGPSLRSNDPKYKLDNLSYSYYSELDSFIVDNTKFIKAWIHGHTHSGHFYKIEETDIICNPRGYGSIINNKSVKDFKLDHKIETYSRVFRNENKNFNPILSYQI